MLTPFNTQLAIFAQIAPLAKGWPLSADKAQFDTTLYPMAKYYPKAMYDVLSETRPIANADLSSELARSWGNPFPLFL